MRRRRDFFFVLSHKRLLDSLMSSSSSKRSASVVRRRFEELRRSASKPALPSLAAAWGCIADDIGIPMPGMCEGGMPGCIGDIPMKGCPIVGKFPAMGGVGAGGVPPHG